MGLKNPPRDTLLWKTMLCYKRITSNIMSGIKGGPDHIFSTFKWCLITHTVITQDKERVRVKGEYVGSKSNWALLALVRWAASKWCEIREENKHTQKIHRVNHIFLQGSLDLAGDLDRGAGVHLIHIDVYLHRPPSTLSHLKTSNILDPIRFSPERGKRKIDIQTQTHRHKHRQTDRQIDRQIYKH